MDSSTDHYVTLGVLPDAEDVVIVAAYRALIQRYHPDRWTGSRDYAHERSAAINEAFRILSDPISRKEYDRTRPAGDCGDFSPESEREASEAFDSALQGLEERWSVACSIYPDLKELRAGLARVSTSLAFAYVSALLEQRSFPSRKALAASAERSFLQRYFGTNERILDFARRLIHMGHKDAAKALNRLIDVMGCEVEPDLLIRHIDDRFLLREALARARADNARKQRLESLTYEVLSHGPYDEARELAQLLGYVVEEITSGILQSRLSLKVRSALGEERAFSDPVGFINWVRSSLCQSAA